MSNHQPEQLYSAIEHTLRTLDLLDGLVKLISGSQFGSQIENVASAGAVEQSLASHNARSHS